MALGRKVSYVTDACTAPVLRQWAGDAEVIEFPVTGVEESKRYAADLLERLQPALLISIERCGRNRNDEYLNMRGRSITSNTARVDYLFDGSVPSVGIGDGGNEIGMGNLADIIPSVDSLPDDPAIAEVDRLVIASVSNWGGYGLVAAISRLAREQPAAFRRVRSRDGAGHGGSRGGGRHNGRRRAHGGQLQHGRERGVAGPPAPIGRQYSRLTRWALS